MTLELEITGWLRGAARESETIHEQLSTTLTRASAVPARLAVKGWDLEIRSTMLATPARIGSELGALVPIVDQAVIEERDRLSSGAPVSPALLGLLNLGNTLECLDCHLESKSWDAMRAWLSRVRVSRDDEPTHNYWTTGFASLALGDRVTYGRFAGYVGEVPTEPAPSCPTAPRGRISFQPGQTFQFNVQGLLRYFAGAVEQGAAFEDVVPAWEDLLWSYPTLRASRSLDPGTLLWIARVAFHRIGGCSLGEVAQRLHDSAWALARVTP